MRHQKTLRRSAAVAIWGLALGVFAFGEAAAESPSELASGKKGREPCESDDECETKVCKDGACDPCPDRENCPPPGRCTKKEHGELDAAKGKACSVKRTCAKVKNVHPSDPGDTDCRELKALEAQGRRCVDARWNIMKTCFDEGNAAHVEEHERDEKVRQFCQDAIEQRMALNLCYDCDNFDAITPRAACADRGGMIKGVHGERDLNGSPSAAGRSIRSRSWDLRRDRPALRSRRGDGFPRPAEAA